MCTTRVNHTAAGDPLRRRSESVTVESATRINGEWSELQPIVTPDAEWVAWVETTRWLPETPSSFYVDYRRDFSFQFMNSGVNGRPPEDGLYRSTVTITGQTLAVNSNERTEEVEFALTLDGEESQWDIRWVPTEEEKERYGHFLDFSGLEEDEEPGLEDDGGASGADGSGM